MIRSILLCGVGGQGILLAARIIASAAEQSGYQVCANEIHGMAQRGGSVTATIRYGEDVLAPLPLEGTVDAIASLEHIEALRCAHFLKPDGFAAVARQSVVPVTVTTGAAVYPPDAEVEARLRKVFGHLAYADCTAKAQELGDVRLANTLLVGMLSRALPELADEAWEKAIRSLMKPELIDRNLNAFKIGKTL